LIKKLHQNSLGLALVAVVSGEALADSRAVVTDTTSRAVASLNISKLHRESGDAGGYTASCVEARAGEGISGGRAFDKRAVRSAETVVTLATIVVASIPCVVVCGTNIGVFSCGGRTGVGELDGELVVVRIVGVVVSELLDGLAGTVSVAVVRAAGAAAALTPVSLGALAFAGLAVATSDTGALDALFVVIVCLRGCGPGASRRASAFRAVSASPCRHFCGNSKFRLTALEACTAVLRLRLACTVSTACVGAECVCAGKAQGDRSEEKNLHVDCVGVGVKVGCGGSVLISVYK